MDRGRHYVVNRHEQTRLRRSHGRLLPLDSRRRADADRLQPHRWSIRSAGFGSLRRSLSWVHAYLPKVQERRYKLKRVTSKKKMCAKLQAVKAETRRRAHRPVPDQGHWLARVWQGHYNDYAVPDNSEALSEYRWRVIRHCRAAPTRRSKKRCVKWPRAYRLADLWLPQPQILHPWPDARFDAKNPRKEPSWLKRTLGSVRGQPEPSLTRRRAVPTSIRSPC